MFDPLTALGLAGNLIQIISFTSDLVTEGNKLYRDANGASAENKTIEDVSEDLHNLTTRLKLDQDAWQAKNPLSILDPDDLLLRNLCERCAEIAIELQRRLSQLKAKEGRAKRLRSYKQAFVTVWQKDAIEELAGRLERYRREIDTRVLFGLRQSLHDADLKNTLQFNALDQSTQDILLAVGEGGHLDSKIDAQTDMLRSIALNQDATNHLLLSVSAGATRSPSPQPAVLNEAPTAESLSQGLQLCEASSKGDITSVRKFMRDLSVDVNTKDKDGFTPLHRAATAEIVKLLLRDEQIKRHAEDDEGRTALHTAVLARRLGVVKALLEAGLDKSWTDDHGKAALAYALESPAANFMLRYGHYTERRMDEYQNNTGLFEMAWLGDLEGLKFYLAQGGDVNSRNSNQETALTEASRHGSLEVVELLLQHKADVSVVDQHKSSAISLAADMGRISVLRLLLIQGPKVWTPWRSINECLNRACRRRQFEVAKILIEGGADVNARRDQNITPLISAAYHDNADFVKWAIERGAGINDGDSNGCYSLLLASKHGHEDCVRELLKHGANVNIKGHNGRTALIHAAEQGHHVVAAMLLEAGGDMEDTSSLGLTALAHAAGNGHTQCITLLLTHGANIEARVPVRSDGSGGTTPLMLAARNGHADNVTQLLDHGADISAGDNYSTTALHLAAERAYVGTVHLLLDRGANVNLAGHLRQTPLHAAAKQHNPNIVKALLDKGADPCLRDMRTRTPWTVAKHRGTDDSLAELLRPDTKSRSHV